MIIEEKRKRLREFCCGQDCYDCILSKLPYCNEKNWDCFTDNEIDECYYFAFCNEQPKEEINHPDRYAGGKYECINHTKVFIILIQKLSINKTIFIFYNIKRFSISFAFGLFSTSLSKHLLIPSMIRFCIFFSFSSKSSIL